MALQHKKFLTDNKELLISFLVAVVSAALLFIFPVQGAAQELTASLFFLFLIPLLYIKFILKKGLPYFNWQIGEYKRGITCAGISLAFSLLIFYILANYTKLPEEYYLPAIIRQKFGFFLLYEIFITGFFLFLYEFFFRGFIMSSQKEKLYRLAPMSQFFLFLLFLWLGESFNWNGIFYIITAFFSGITTFISRSLWYSLAYGFLFILIADAVIIKLAK